MTIVKIPSISCNGEVVNFTVVVTLDDADKKHKVIEKEEELRGVILEYLDSIL